MMLLRSTVSSTDSSSDTMSGHHMNRTLDRSPERLYQTNMLVRFPPVTGAKHPM